MADGKTDTTTYIIWITAVLTLISLVLTVVGNWPELKKRLPA